MYDLIIKNGTIVDGASSPMFKGDIGISDGIITDIGLNLENGKEVIDAAGLIVSPGFIDMHTHSDVSFVDDELCASKLYQGVTFELSGCCGFSFYPSNESGLKRLVDYIDEEAYSHLVSQSFESFVEKTNDLNKAIHWGTYIGHGTLRVAIVGHEDVKATEEQMIQMEEILESELKKGAFGLSLGIAYAPGMFTDIDELVRLSKVCAKYNRIVTAHIRNENVHVFEAIEEMIEIGRQSGAHVHISHLKLGYGSWYKTDQLFELIDDAREEGINITIEQYPYNASSTGLSAVLPNWVHAGGVEKILDRFKNEREEVLKGIRESNSYKMGLDRVVVVSTKGLLPDCDGKSVRAIAKVLNVTDEEAVVWLLERSNCNIPTIRFTMEYEDVYKIMAREDCAVISDGSAYSLDKSKVNGMPHPRNYGTFPRFLRLNREKEFMSLEAAVHKMTGLPKKLTGLVNRGLIKEGLAADITIFNYDEIKDTADFGASISKPEGIEYVIVNGDIVIDKGQVTDKRPGQVILCQS